MRTTERKMRCLAGVVLSALLVTTWNKQNFKHEVGSQVSTRSLKIKLLRSGNESRSSDDHLVPPGCATVVLPEGVQKSLFRHATAKRPTSYPYIAGDTIRSFADHVFDETEDAVNWTERAAGVQHGDIVFLKTDFMAKFFKEVFPRARHSFVLATHNSDASAPSVFASFLDDRKLLAWYAMNPDAVHPKLTPLPISFANAHWRHGSPVALQAAFNASRGPWQARKHGVYVNIKAGTNKAKRSEALRQAASLKDAHFHRG